MAVRDNDSAEKIAEMQTVWNVYRGIFATKGIDIAMFLSDLSGQAMRLAQQQGAEDSFDRLREAGCLPKSLAIGMALFHPLRSINAKSNSLAGTARQRKQRMLAIEKSATALEEMLISVQSATEDDESLGPFSLSGLKGASGKSASAPSGRLLLKMAADPLDLEKTISTLRIYLSFLQAFELSQNRSNSDDGFAKYFVSAYVKRVTGRFHDAEVSSLIGVAIGADYDVTAHRMWRVRNYKQIDSGLSGLADMFVDLSVVLAT